MVSLAVLLASATWFSGTAASAALMREWGLDAVQGAWLTISVQLGFIAGTLLYALLNLSDVFNARMVFCFSALLGAAFNAAFGFASQEWAWSLLYRFFTGVTLAGVYPVAMKIVASHFESGLGWRLGVMVGALTLGTASPYLLQTLGSGLDWRVLVGVGSASAVVGGLIMVWTVKDGPYLSGRARFDAGMALRVFSSPLFRATAFGYFGHMWELYAFWSLIGFYLQGNRQLQTQWLSLELAVFAIIAIGAVGCLWGGWMSRRWGERRVALISLWVSGGACLASGLVFQWPEPLLVLMLLVWGFFVVSDSPQFSALAARHAPAPYTGTALTIYNGVGFAVTVASIQLLPWLAGWMGWRWAFTPLALGPLIGVYFTSKLPAPAPRGRASAGKG